MKITQDQKRIIESVINVFETGSVNGNYGSVSVYADGKNGQRQVTYGRSQTTEEGSLKHLMISYFEKFGAYSHELERYLPIIGKGVLHENFHFKKLLHDAGSDPIMIECQDELFDKRYYQQALLWAEDHLFFLPLSMLVIYDSWIHSGTVPNWLRRRFQEPIPDNGGDEKTWIEQYVNARRNWLATNINPVLHNTVYRMDTIGKLIDDDNWFLIPPFMAHGVKIK